MARRILASAVLIVCAAICLAGVRAHGLYGQPVWTSAGLLRFAVFAALYTLLGGSLVLLAPRWLLPSLGAAATLFSATAVGWGAVAGALWITAGCWALGWLCAGRNLKLAAGGTPVMAAAGLAVWSGIVMWTAPLAVHYRVFYLLAPGAAIAAALGHGWRPRLAAWSMRGRADAVAWAVGLFPLACHWLISLKPEVSADGLAMHMVIPARMSVAHRWPFDVDEFAWAVMPMGGDWVWTIAWQVGGEACARLLNVVLLLMIVWIVARAARPVLPEWPAALLAGAFLATPLVEHATGSLFVENATALWITAAAAVLFETNLAGARAQAAFGLFCGMALATKFGAAAFILPLAAAAVWTGGWRRAAGALPWTLAAGCVPYATAWVRTGNPVFPFLNAVFRSPYYEAVNFRDTRFEAPPGWTTFYDLTFRSRRFLEGWDGAAGFLPFLLLPPALASWRRDWPRGSTALAVIVLAGSAISFRAQSNLRYLYPALPLIAWLAASALASLRSYPVTFRLASGALALAYGLNLSLMPAAGWYHRDFFVARWWAPRQDTTYILEYAPERKLVEWLNAHAPDSTTAWLETNAIADFRGRAFTNSWHSARFFRDFHRLASPEEMEALMRARRIQFFVAPAAGSGQPLSSVYERQFLDDCTAPAAQSGAMELRRWNMPGGCREAPAQFAPPGRYDELSRYVRFRGPWTRDLQFTAAYLGTLVYSNDPRAEARIHFEGAAVRVAYTAAFNRCRAEALLDGQPAGAVEQYSGQVRWQQWSAWFRAPAAGRHVLRLRKAHGSVEPCFIDLDGFEVR